MTVILSRVTVAAAVVLGLSSMALAREAGPQHRGAGKATGLHGIGFNEPSFGAAVRTGKNQPYTWPVSDRYRPISQPYYGRAY
ncbi:hypothetical protein SAMN05216360_12420 [Methylobacterium phyllostachyos]|uniref:BA14K family protein n=1 Tax=Methylobacterium phyllostachyos TaxID=582672 RepID=A0A1H0JYD4_9HYPH|nr:hypothetical protein [Methylobacterium phyllostachyos]SDO48755.1 hypothetical protein SAMN05216360_12420 [Methylobacterium phyllostachyos]